MFRAAFAASFFFVVGGLLAVGIVSWLRTGGLRRGTIPQARDPPSNAYLRASRATLLAAVAGISAMAWGASASASHPMQAVILAATGAFIALAGWVARVTGLRADDDGLIILFARRPPFGVSWSEVRELKPPTSPVGGWRLTDARGVRSTLMPSDLFGHEELLETIVVRAGLQFDGRIWSWNATGAPGEGPTVSGLIPRKR